MAQQNLALQQLLGMPSLPSTAQLTLDAAKKQAEAAYANAVQSYETAQTAALQAQATQLLSEQLVRELLIKQIAEANGKRETKEAGSKHDNSEDSKTKDHPVPEESCKRPRTDKQDNDPEVIKHNAEEKVTDEARRAFEKQRRADDETTTRRERDRAMAQNAGRHEGVCIILDFCIFGR